MMKIAAIVGTNADFSYNRLLLKYMKKHFKQLADIDVLEIAQLPAFDQDQPYEEQSMEVWKFKQTVRNADGVIFSCPEYDHAIPAALISAIEWLFYNPKNILEEKPTMVVGVSYGTQATSRAQEQVRAILASPDCNAAVLSGHEVLVGKAANNFTKDGNITDAAAVKNLEESFTSFIQLIDALESRTKEDDLVTLKQPFVNEAYINFPTGRLTFKEAQQIFSTIPFEIDLIDRTDHFAWFSDKPNREHVRHVNEVGETVDECHPPKALPAVKAIINSFKDGSKDMVERPLIMHGHRTLIQYYALRDVDGSYLGTIEFTGSVEHIIGLFENGAFADVTSGASKHAAADTTTAASEDTGAPVDNAADGAADATTSASKTEEASPIAVPAQNDQHFKAGKYTVQAKGHNGDFPLDVTLSDDRIEAVEVKGDTETKGIGDTAYVKLPAEIVAGQTLNVDVVTGASDTSHGIINGVAEAVKQAGGNPDALKARAKYVNPNADTEDKTIETDVAVIGGGGAGLSAAATILDQGKKVILLEKTAALGGNTVRAGGPMNAADPEWQNKFDALPGEDKSLQAFLDMDVNDIDADYQDDFKTLQKQITDYLADTKKSGHEYLFDSVELHRIQTYLGGVRTDLKGNRIFGKYPLVKKLTDNALTSQKWLDKIGVEFDYSQVTMPVGALWRRGHKPVKEAGFGYISALGDYIKAHNGQIMLESPVTELIHENGQVKGVIVKKANGQTITIHAQAVILASGGFGANTKMVQKYNTYWSTIDDNIATTNSPAITGDGIRLGESVGAGEFGMGFIQMMPVSDPDTGELFSGIQCPPANFVMVNNKGKRFVNEFAERDVLAQAAFDNGGLFYLIADNEIKKTAYNTSEEKLEQQVKEGRLFKADTLDDLAKQINVDPATLKDTVTKYNSYVDAGKDPEFGKNVFDLKVEHAPFYATPRRPAIHHTMGGLTIDPDAHVLDKDGAKINGLYAAGEVAGGLHAGNRLGGNSLADIFTFGPIAAKTAIGELVDTVSSASKND